MKILPLPDGKFLLTDDKFGEQVADNHYVALQARDAILEQHDPVEPEPIPDPADWTYDGQEQQ